MVRIALACLAVLASASAAFPATFTVAPDGTGDFPTIQAALDASASGDVVELADGVFTGDGNRDLDFLGKALTLRSLGGPAACAIDCEGSETDQHRGIVFQNDEGPGSVVEGVTIMHGWVDAYGGTYGGGIYCADDASPTIRNCVLHKNQAAYGGGMCGGAYSEISGCAFVENEAVRGGGLGRSPHATITGCSFTGNLGTYGGGIYIRSSCSPTLTDCLFEGNEASHSGGALHIEQHCNPVLRRCTLTGNSSPIGGAFDVSIECAPILHNCTLSGNSCAYTGTVSCYEYCVLTFENTIIAHEVEGQAVSCYDSEVALLCCDLYGNAGGDWVGYVADQLGSDGNICEDPLFCGDENPSAPYSLHNSSPCAPAYNPSCGLVGAWDVGCCATSVAETSWGAVKATYAP